MKVGDLVKCRDMIGLVVSAAVRTGQHDAWIVLLCDGRVWPIHGCDMEVISECRRLS